MIEQLTKQEIGQIKQEIIALENEKKAERGGLRVSQVDRQIATNEVAKKYGMTGIDLARLVGNKSLPTAKTEKKEAVATDDALIEQMNQLTQKYADDMEALKAAVAERQKPAAKADKDDAFKGQYVYVYVHQDKRNRKLVFRVVSRGREQIHICYFENIKNANRVARNIDNVVCKVVENMAGDK